MNAVSVTCLWLIFLYSHVILSLEYEIGCFSLFMQSGFNGGIAPLCILISRLMPGRNFWSRKVSIHFVQVHSQRVRMNFKLFTLINILFSCQEGFQSIGVRCVSLRLQITIAEAADAHTKGNHFFALIWKPHF